MVNNEDLEYRKKKAAQDQSETNLTSAKSIYSLRPRTRVKRLQQQQQQQENSKRDDFKKASKAKSRPAPLSKYRRKTANARERHRMQEINNAFETLRKALPLAFEKPSSNTTTKITTLKLAVQYIQALSKVLEEEEEDDAGSSPSPATAYLSSLQQNVGIQLVVAPPEIKESYFRCQVPTSHAYNDQGTTTVPLTVQVSMPSISSSRAESLSSTSSDFEDILSDDSVLLEDNTDVFHDIPTLPGPVPFELLLGQERETLIYQQQEFCV